MPESRCHGPPRRRTLLDASRGCSPPRVVATATGCTADPPDPEGRWIPTAAGAAGGRERRWRAADRIAAQADGTQGPRHQGLRAELWVPSLAFRVTPGPPRTLRPCMRLSARPTEAQLDCQPACQQTPQELSAGLRIPFREAPRHTGGRRVRRRSRRCALWRDRDTRSRISIRSQRAALELTWVHPCTRCEGLCVTISTRSGIRSEDLGSTEFLW